MRLTILLITIITYQINNGLFAQEQEKTKTIYLGYITEVAVGQSTLYNAKPFQQISQLPNEKSIQLSQYIVLNNFFVQLGVCLNQASFSSTQQKIKQYNFTRYDTINTHTYIINGQHISESVVNQTEYTVDSIYHVTGTDNQSFISIPINIGYRWRFRHYALYAKFGMRTNIISSSNYYNGTKHTTNHIRYTAQTSAIIEIPLTQLFSIMVEPNYAQDFNKALYKHQLGIRVGLQLWL